MVGVSGRAVKMVAPNSPRLMVNAKMEAAMTDFEIRGKMMCRNVAMGDAPSVADASVNTSGMDRMAGRIARMTNGNPTRAWAMGIKKKEVRRLRGGLSRVMMIPKPKVTADVDSGSMNIGSNRLDQERVNRRSQKRIKSAAHNPVIRAMTRAHPANAREYPTA